MLPPPPGRVAVAHAQQVAAHAAVGLEAQAARAAPGAATSAGPPRSAAPRRRRSNAGASVVAAAGRARRAAPRQRTASGVVRQVARRAAPTTSRASRRRRAARSTDPRLAGEQRLALEQLAQRVEVARRSRRGTPRRTPSPRPTAALISAPRVVVLEDDRHDPRTPGSRRTAERASAAIRYAKFGAHCGVGSRRRTLDVPLRRHDAGADEAERGDRLVELRVVDRAERREDRATSGLTPALDRRRRRRRSAAASGSCSSGRDLDVVQLGGVEAEDLASCRRVSSRG